MTAHRSARTARLALLAAGAALLVWVLGQFEWREVGARLVDPRPAPAALTVVACLAYLFVRSWRWFLLLEPAQRALGFWPLHASTALAIALGNFFPLQAGEYAKVEWLARRGGVSRLEPLGAFLVERLLDLTVLASMLLAGLAVWLGQGELPAWTLAALAVAVAGGVATLAVLSRRHAAVQRVLAPARTLLRAPGRACGALALTALSWFLVIVSWSALGHTLGIELGLGPALSLCASVTAIRVLSCVPAGIGVDEAGVVALMPLLGHAAAAAQAYALALRALDLLLVMLALPFVWCLRRRPDPVTT